MVVLVRKRYVQNSVRILRGSILGPAITVWYNGTCPIFKIIRLLLKPSFSSHSVILCGSYEGNPLSPQKGEAACGKHHLYPLFFRIIIFNIIRCFRNRGDDESGGGGSTTGWSPQERLIVSMRVSTKLILTRKTLSSPWDQGDTGDQNSFLF